MSAEYYERRIELLKILYLMRERIDKAIELVLDLEEGEKKDAIINAVIAELNIVSDLNVNAKKTARRLRLII